MFSLLCHLHTEAEAGGLPSLFQAAFATVVRPQSILTAVQSSAVGIFQNVVTQSNVEGQLGLQFGTSADILHVLILTNSVTLGKLHKRSVPQFPHL